MKKGLLGLIGIVVICVIIMGLITRKSAATTVASGYKFNYYPELNAYYDYTQQNLMYTLDGGKNWTEVKKQTDQLPATLGKAYTFYSPDPAAWLNNSEHRIKYKGINSNYVADAQQANKMDINNESLVAKEGKEREKKKQKASEYQKEEQKERDKEDKKEKKGSKAFLKKLDEKIKRLDEKLFKS